MKTHLFDVGAVVFDLRSFARGIFIFASTSAHELWKLTRHSFLQSFSLYFFHVLFHCLSSVLSFSGVLVFEDPGKVTCRLRPNQICASREASLYPRAQWAPWATIPKLLGRHLYWDRGVCVISLHFSLILPYRVEYGGVGRAVVGWLLRKPKPRICVTFPGTQSLCSSNMLGEAVSTAQCSAWVMYCSPSIQSINWSSM